MSDRSPIEVFYDGACPICSHEMAVVHRLDRRHAIECTDIAACDFDAVTHGLNAKAVNQHIHARLSDGRIVTGVEVFRQMYDLLGFRRWVAWSRRPWVAKMLDNFYAVFARNRRFIGRPFRD